MRGVDEEGRGLPESSGKEVCEASSEPSGNAMNQCTVYCQRQAWTSATEDQIREVSGFMGCVAAVMHSPTPLGVKMVGDD